MPAEVVETEHLEAEQALLNVRANLEKLHRLAPHTLPKSKFATIISLLPTSQEILAPPPPQGAATASAFATFRFIRTALVSTVFRLWWTIIYGLALIGGATVGVVFFAYLITKLPWETTYTSGGQSWGSGDWQRSWQSYATAVTSHATKITEVPELDAREL
ncbi:hypothetical protein DRE_00088 [Drechslerella stenobrocha 248]|uniref:Uncharacterized protein n=1 Tax=Drechslerella stenobrocha 248 TaxID=1043628 RepID=W7I8Z3_9PEZI|nr:hypothetical protein DRE_00088 [Drechslerella stenobrocha 248]